MPDPSRTLKWVVTLALGLLVLGASRASWAGPRLELSGPSTALGDGKTTVKITLRADPPEMEIGNLEIQAPSGRIGKLQALGQGRFDFEYTPPRVAETTSVEIVASVRGRQTRSAPLKLEVQSAQVVASELKTGGPLGLRVPGRMVLGQDTEATIHLTRPPGSEVTLSVNVGSVDPLQEQGANELSAVYHPPEEKYPQLAIFAATSADGALVDWAVVPLWGRPRVTARSEPHTAVRIRVATEEYGPFRTSVRGTVEARVLAPPGVAEALVLARDAAGNESQVPLELGVPEYGRSLALCPESTGDLLLFAVDRSGRPRPALDLDLKSSAGQFRSARQTAQGFYRAVVDLPADARLGEPLELEVGIRDEPESHASCTTRVAGEPPRRLRVTLDRAKYVAGTGRPVEVQVELQYPGKRQPRQVPLAAETSIGDVSPLRQVSPTSYSAQWTLPDQLAGLKMASITIRTVGSPELSGVATLELRSGAVKHLDLAATPWRIVADGHATTQIIVRPVDAANNPVIDATLEGSAEGDLGPFESIGPGIFAARYLPPADGREAVEVTVRDTAGSAHASATVFLLPATRLLATARLGYLSNLAKVSGPSLALGADYRLPFADEGLLAGLEIGGHTSRTHELDLAGQEEVTVSVSAVTVQARVRYEFPMWPLVPYVGLGAGVAIARASVSSSSTGTVLQSATVLALSPRGGAHIPLGPGRAGLELAYLRALLDEPEIDGNTGGWNLSATYQLPF